jgi:hypothetical protein
MLFKSISIGSKFLDPESKRFVFEKISKWDAAVVRGPCKGGVITFDRYDPVIPVRR